MAYDLFKFLHVAAVIIWIGGVSTLTVLHLRLARDADADAGQAALARASGALGRTVVGPAAVVTLLAGVATAAVGGLDMSDLWLAWGLAGIVVSVGLGATLIRRTTTALEAALTAAAPVTALRSRLTRLNLLNLLVLLSVVGAMVFKPAL